ncbi:MAG: S24 family peptidase [Mucinivorans sp.]
MTNWQRLEQVVRWSGMSTNKFAMSIGLKRSENLYQIKRGNFGISKELARLICAKYPMISRLWLLTGEGQMMEMHASADAAFEVMSKSVGAVAYYNEDALDIADATFRATLKPQYHLVLPAAKDSVYAARVSGTSMAPGIPAGATIVLGAIALDSILLGEAYLVVADGFNVIRFIRSVEGDADKLQLVPRNVTDFDTMVIDRSRIKALYAIKAVINYRTV